MVCMARPLPVSGLDMIAGFTFNRATRTGLATAPLVLASTA